MDLECFCYRSGILHGIEFQLIDLDVPLLNAATSL